MQLTPTPTVAVIHGDGNITQYHPDEDGVTVHESGMMNSGPADISLGFQSFGTSHLRHTVPLRNTLECLGLPDPYSLASLEVAWENAEQADKCHEGDVLITRRSGGYFSVWVSVGVFDLDSKSRVLSPSPRGPWQDLADDLRAHTGEPDPDETARMLHEQGWRKVGGES